MTTSCYLPVFYCFWLSLSTQFVFEILFKELSGLFYCSIVNVLRRCLSHATFVILLHRSLFVNNFFNLFFQTLSSPKLFFCDSHNRLSHLYDLVNKFFDLFLICSGCLLSCCSAHATACLYYHYFSGMSTSFLKYFSNCLKQLKQFTIIYNFDNNANLPTVLWIHM